jgi:uncharacterized protein
MTRPPDDGLLEIYRNVKTIAVVGASGKESKAAFRIPDYLRSQGYRVIAVNPKGGELFGGPVYAKLRDIGVPIDVVDVFRPPKEARAVAKDAIEVGTKVLWFQPDTDTPEAAQLAADAGLTVVAGICMGETHRRLGLGPGPRPAPAKSKSEG